MDLAFLESLYVERWWPIMDFMNLFWTGDLIESTFSLISCLCILELFSVVCAYIGGRR